MANRKRNKKTKPEFEIRRLDQLKPHPLQDLYFGNFPVHKIRALADDIERNELKNPIEVLSANQAKLPVDTIIAGHKRRLALQLLGYEKTEVEVRYDFSEASAPEIELYFLDDNNNRQHLTKLAQARIALRRVEIEKNRDRGDLADWEHIEARDRVGAATGMTGRNLSRYMRILQTPSPVQNAFEKGELTLVTAEKVAGLTDQIQLQIAEQIEEGGVPKTIVESYISNANGRPRDVGTSLSRFLKGLAIGVEELGNRVSEIKKDIWKDDLPDLLEAQALINRLVVQIKRNVKRGRKQKNATQKIAKELSKQE